jgi:hypothetical protein
MDIIMPVSLLSRYLAQGRVGHLEHIYHIFGYLKKYERSCLVFDDSEPIFDDRSVTGVNSITRLKS